MGDVTNVTNITNSAADVRNYILTLIDKLEAGRFEDAFETYDLAKKVNHSEATSAYEIQQRSDISRAWLRGLTATYNAQLKGKSPPVWGHNDANMIPLIAPLERFYNWLDLFLDYDSDSNKGWELQGIVALEFRGFRVSSERFDVSLYNLRQLKDRDAYERLMSKKADKRATDATAGVLIFLGLVVVALLWIGLLSS